MIVDIEYHQSTAITIIVMNGISFLSLLFVLTIYGIRWKKISSFPIRLSFYLCIACILQNLYVLMYNPVIVNNIESRQQIETSDFCNFEAILKVSSDLSSIIWTTLIIYSSFASIVLKHNLQQAQISYLIFGFLFSLITSIIPVFFKLYGFNTYFCWFQATNSNLQFILKSVYYFLPLWIAFFFTIFMSTKVYKTLKNLGLSERELIFFRRLMLFPYIMLGTAFFGTINFIYNFVTHQYPEWLDLLANLGTGLNGLLNSIAYGFNPIIRQQILIVFKIKNQSENDQNEMSEMSRYSRNSSKFQELIK